MPFDLSISAVCGDVATPRYSDRIINGTACYRVTYKGETWLDGLTVRQALALCDLLNSACGADGEEVVA